MMEGDDTEILVKNTFIQLDSSHCLAAASVVGGNGGQLNDPLMGGAGSAKKLRPRIESCDAVIYSDISGRNQLQIPVAVSSSSANHSSSGSVISTESTPAVLAGIPEYTDEEEVSSGIIPLHLLNMSSNRLLMSLMGGGSSSSCSPEGLVLDNSDNGFYLSNLTSHHQTRGGISSSSMDTSSSPPDSGNTNDSSGSSMYTTTTTATGTGTGDKAVDFNPSSSNNGGDATVFSRNSSEDVYDLSTTCSIGQHSAVGNNHSSSQSSGGKASSGGKSSSNNKSNRMSRAARVAEDTTTTTTSSSSSPNSTSGAENPRVLLQEIVNAGTVAKSEESATLDGTTLLSNNTRFTDKSMLLDLDDVPDVGHNKSTIMLRNIPNKYTQKMLLAVVNQEFEGLYDFFYLPIDFRNRCNVGYAFINFIHPYYAEMFKKKFMGMKLSAFKSRKICEVSWGRVQGLQANIEHYRNSAVMSIPNEQYRPILLQNGVTLPFPGPNGPLPIVKLRPMRQLGLEEKT